jgi:hypothetical protein
MVMRTKRIAQAASRPLMLAVGVMFFMAATPWPQS